VEEFHLDGLRIDATQQMFDASPEHILAALASRVREAARGRRTLMVAENEPQHTRLVRPLSEGGYGIDALWNDDFHHSARVALTGHNEAYYTDYLGAPQEFISAVKYGYLYQGQRYKWQKTRRGTPSFGLGPAQFVNYLENHDQLANTCSGERLHKLAAPGCWKALTALTVLAPGTPMLFMGQEFAASAPFLYFADHQPDLARKVREGRAEFLAQFRSLSRPESAACLSDPGDPRRFEACKLDHAERERHGEVYALHKDLLRLRREDFEDPHSLAKLAATCRMSLQAFRDEFEYLVKREPEALATGPAKTPVVQGTQQIQ
jgi:maltooligosyltrehalose trehalohydrolase